MRNAENIQHLICTVLRVSPLVNGLDDLDRYTCGNLRQQALDLLQILDELVSSHAKRNQRHKPTSVPPFPTSGRYSLLSHASDLRVLKDKVLRFVGKVHDMLCKIRERLARIFERLLHMLERVISLSRVWLECGLRGGDWFLARG